MPPVPDAGRLVNAFIQARNWTPAAPGRRIDWLVYHSMENEEKPDGAENVAKWFAGPTAPRASAHYCVDDNSIVQCVLERDIAWAAPDANRRGIHIEQAGKARQTRAEWFDPYSRAELGNTIRLSADIITRHQIPVVWLLAADLQAGKRGLTSHAEVTKAFPGLGRTHWDPGTGFPHDWVLAEIRGLLDPAPSSVARWSAYVGATRIGRGSLLNPAFVMRITAALRAAGHSAPWKATVDGLLLATGRFWPATAFTRTVATSLRAGHTVTLNDTVKLLKETP